jgi:histidinol-phosphate aminotransferase
MSPGIRKEVQRLKGYTLETPSCRVKLNQNESPSDLPDHLKKKILGRMAELAWNRYPTPFCDPLRQKIAQKVGWYDDGVIVSAGSNILIQAVMIAASVNGKIMTVTPSFSLYEIEGLLLGNRVIEVPLSREDFSLPRDLFLKRLKKERPNLVFLANPNAPTGNLFLEEDLIAVLKTAKSLGTLVVIDEAYYPFSGFTLFHRLRMFSNLVLVRTLSKAYSLGGARLGYLLADPKIAAEVIKVVLPFHVSQLTQAVGEVVLEEDSYVSPLVNEIIQEREVLYQTLKSLQGITVYPSHTNFLLFQSSRSKEIFGKLLEEGILIRDVSHHDLPNSLRVSVGTREENRLFLEAMAKITTVKR